MGKVRGELEDLAFQHLDPEAWAEISSVIEKQRTANEDISRRCGARWTRSFAAKEFRPAWKRA